MASPEAESTLISWSSVNQFDDMVWEDFVETEDHSMPPGDLAQGLWMLSGDCLEGVSFEATATSLKKSGQSFLDTEQKPGSTKPSEEENGRKPKLPDQSHLFKDIQSGYNIFDANSAVVLKAVLEKEPASFKQQKGEMWTSSPSQLEVKEESSDLGLSTLYMNDTGYQKDDSSLISHSNSFPFFELCNEDSGLELCDAESNMNKGENLLENIWKDFEKFDDVDSLLPNEVIFPGIKANTHVNQVQRPSSSESLMNSNMKNCETDKKCLFTVQSNKSEKNDEKVQDDESEKDRTFPIPRPLELENNQKTLGRDRIPHCLIIQGNEFCHSMNAEEVSAQHSNSAEPLHSSNDILTQVNRSRQQDLTRSRNKFKRESPYRRGRCSTHSSSRAQTLSMKEQHVAVHLPLEQREQTPSAPPSFQGVSPALQPLFMLNHSFVYQQMPQQFPVLPMSSAPAIYHFPVVVADPPLCGPQLHYPRPLLVSTQHPFTNKQTSDFVRMEPIEAPGCPLREKKTASMERLKTCFQVDKQAMPESKDPEQKFENVLQDLNKNYRQQTTEDGAFIAAGVSKFVDFSGPELGTSNYGALMPGTTCEDKETLEQMGACTEERALHQLQSIILKLDARTRLLIRDALYRLSKSAMHRQSIGEFVRSKGAMKEAILANEITHTPCKVGFPIPSNVRRLVGRKVQAGIGGVVVEAETNRVDRIIANMLFNECSYSLCQSSADLHGNHVALGAVCHQPLAPGKTSSLYPSVAPR